MHETIMLTNRKYSTNTEKTTPKCIWPAEKQNKKKTKQQTFTVSHEAHSSKLTANSKFCVNSAHS